MIIAVHDEQGAYDGKGQQTLCWLRVSPHHYGLYVDAFTFEPTKETPDEEAFSRIDVDAFANKLQLLLSNAENLRSDTDEDVVPLVLEGNIEQYKQEMVK